MGTKGLSNFTVVPPGMGICHQVNLEYLAQGITSRDGWLFPDTLVGTDSHTPMVNGIGVIAWGVGGIEAEAAMLGQPIFFLPGSCRIKTFRKNSRSMHRYRYGTFYHPASER